MNDFGEIPKPEFKEYSLENFGYILRDSATLSPEVFPYKVGFSKKSNFFRSIYNDLYKGKGTTVRGSVSAIRPGGIFAEHEATLAANDLGELMVSREIFEGNMLTSLTKLSSPEYYKHTTMLKNVPFPPGWRSFGYIHSHPVDDIGNEPIMTLASQIPKVNGVSLTWSGGDFNSFIHEAKYGLNGFTTLGLITQTQLSFMVASNLTVDTLKKSYSDLREFEVKSQGFPPYKRFAELGIILYGGRHFNRNDKVNLERLT